MNTRCFSCATLILLTCISCRAASSDFPEPEAGQGYSPAEAEYLVLGERPAVALLGCQTPQTEFITDDQIYPQPDLPEPAPRAPFLDPVFGTCLVRVTDRERDPLNPGDDSRGLKNEYSRVQSFNADGSLLLARSIEAHWYVYDARSLQPLGEVPAEVEPRWDARDPDLLYYSAETRLMSYDLDTGETQLIHDFAADLPGQDLAAVWTRYEGSPSYDTRYWGLLAQNADWEAIAFLVYDRELGTAALKQLPRPYAVDNATISPLGNYFLASFDDYCGQGELGNDQHPCGLMVYDRSLERGRGLLRIIGHYDTALDAAGREVVVYQDIDTDMISLLDLATGAVTPLLALDFSRSSLGLHFSGRAQDQPGWVLISTYNGSRPAPQTWMDDTVFALELKPGGRVIRLAQTHSVYDESMEKDYWAEPQATVNRDFTRVLFTSNWGRTGSEQVDLYQVILPEGWIASLP